MTPTERRKLAQHLARYLFHVVDGPDRIAGMHRQRDAVGGVLPGERAGAGLCLESLADHLEAELSRYVLAERKAKRARGRR